MANTRHAVTITLPADGDLSSNQFRIVGVDDNGRAQIQTGVATPCIGILMNKPAATDRPAEIAIVGSIVKVEAGAALNERDYIRANTGGIATATTTAEDEVVGIALSAAAASADLFEMLVIGPANYPTA